MVNGAEQSHRAVGRDSKHEPAGGGEIADLAGIKPTFDQRARSVRVEGKNSWATDVLADRLAGDHVGQRQLQGAAGDHADELAILVEALRYLVIGSRGDQDRDGGSQTEPTNGGPKLSSVLVGPSAMAGVAATSHAARKMPMLIVLFMSSPS